MFFTASLHLALAIFGLGLLFKVSTWFRYSFDAGSGNMTPVKRVSAAIKGIILTVFSGKILTLLKVLVLDVILQNRILKEDFLRWLMHMLIYVGFMMLLLMHALEQIISVHIFSEYYSTLNPFFFLRDLFGLMVFAGLGIALYRRFILNVPNLRTNAMDLYAIVILAVVMISGVVLEGVKITSYTVYQEMVADYADSDDPEELMALESVWVKDFGVVSPNVTSPFDQEVMAQGRDMHEMSCAGCHSSPKWAFTGYLTAKILSPIALAMDRAGLPAVLWYIHFMACFIGLAYLPFSKMFHIFASPLSLLANAVMDGEESDPANIATRQIMELDACTHCGTCSLRCSVGVCFEEVSNINIFPSEKLGALKALAAGKKLSEQELMDIQDGLYLCTNCYRCTGVCPSGINLQDLWFNVREALLQRGYPELLALSPLSFYRGLRRDDITEDNYKKPLQVARKAIDDECNLTVVQDDIINLTLTDKRIREVLKKSAQGNSFSYCFSCFTCTTACPVVNSVDNLPEDLGLVPHQIIRAAVVGLSDPIFSSNMLWSCLGCYECQEHCPQGVCITDVFYELKNLAIKNVSGKKPN
jgi:heterodisulfide reductase subunit C/nitrate reductase gamma subunit